MWVPSRSFSLVRTRTKTQTDFCEGRIVAATNDIVLIEIIKLIAMIWLFPFPIVHASRRGRQLTSSIRLRTNFQTIIVLLSPILVSSPIPPVPLV